MSARAPNASASRQDREPCTSGGPLSSATALGTVRLHSSERRVNLLFGHALFVSLQVFDVLPFSLAAREPTRRLMREGACSRRAGGSQHARARATSACAALCVRPRAGGRAPGRTRRAWSGWMRRRWLARLRGLQHAIAAGMPHEARCGKTCKQYVSKIQKSMRGAPTAV